MRAVGDCSQSLGQFTVYSSQIYMFVTKRR
jgi:hypothetical protein